MTIIFQLFCVDDLKLLFKALHEQHRDANEFFNNLGILTRDQPSGGGPSVQAPDASGAEPAEQAPDAKRFVLNATNDPILASGENTPQAALEALRERIRQVTQQLRSSRSDDPATLPQIDPSQPSLGVPATPDPITSQLSEEENQIRGWAISCDVNFFNFYYPLLQIREHAYKQFFEATKQRPKGPDSLYSPFNPVHPLYHLFYDMEVEAGPVEGSEGSTSTET